MTTFFNWRVLTYDLPVTDIHLQKSIAVNSHQAIYALVWKRCTFRTLRSASALDTSNPGKVSQIGRPVLDTRSGPTLSVIKVPFSVLTNDACQLKLHPLRKLHSSGTIKAESLVNGELSTRPGVDITNFPYNQQRMGFLPPAKDRQMLLQSSSTPDGVYLVLLDGTDLYIYRTRTKEWLEPLSVSEEPLNVRQLISVGKLAAAVLHRLGGSLVFIQFIDRTGRPQFGLIDAYERSVNIPFPIPALPRSHGITFFLDQLSNSLDAIVDRWPRCTREWWSVSMDTIIEVKEHEFDDDYVIRCNQINSEAIELHYAEYIPIGNRWLLGILPSTWTNEDRRWGDDALIPSENMGLPNYKTVEPPLAIVDKAELSVRSIRPASRFSDELKLSCQNQQAPKIELVNSPSFYVPYKITDKATVEVPAILLQRNGQLIIRMWGGSTSNVPTSVAPVWSMLNQMKIDENLIIRIFSYLLN